jgi:hypothetical protein
MLFVITGKGFFKAGLPGRAASASRRIAGGMALKGANMSWASAWNVVAF